MKNSILIVEDDENLADTLKSLLEMEDFSVTTCLRPHDALSTLKTEVPDLIILDFMMPMMNGVEFLHAIKGISSLKDIPVILMTASKEPDKTGGLSWTFIKKPFDIDLLLKLIHNELKK